MYSNSQIAKFAVAALTIAVGAMSAVADAIDHDWVTFLDGTRAEYQYDTLSLERVRGGMVRAWVKTSGNKDSLIAFEKEHGEGMFAGFKARSKYSDYSHTISQWEVNCERRTGGSGVTIEYDRKGSVIETSNSNPNHGPIIPDTAFEVFFLRVC